MASSIDITKPAATSATTASVRTNFEYAHDEIEALQTGKADAGANTDITSLAGLTTALSVAQGGTGQTTMKLILTTTLSADGQYTGITDTGTAGTALAFGDLIYFDPTDSKWELADANSAAAADGDPRGRLGMCVLAAVENAATTILFYGKIRADAVFPTLTINAPAYVGETAGDIVVTQPTTADVVIRVVGFAIDANTLFFNPSADYLTHV